jgi:hypothetical protein
LISVFNKTVCSDFRFATKKSSKSRKRKRLSYESEASGDEAAKDAVVKEIVDEIPESLVEVSELLLSTKLPQNEFIC